MTLEAEISVQRRGLTVEAHLALAHGERLSLFGPSGAGKTTMLEAVAGTVRLASGEVRLAGRIVNIAGRSRRLGGTSQPPQVEPRNSGVSMVRQPTTLFPHLSAAANVGYRTVTSAEQSLEAVGMAGLGEAMPGALSGGQRQRVALARAIARPFAGLLLDEPFSAVDANSRPALRDLAVEYARRNEAIAILVTHDLFEAQAFGDRVAIVDGGRILQTGDPEALVRAPSTRRVAELVGYSAFLDRDAKSAWALHADRFAPGAVPENGLVIEGRVLAVRAYGPRFTCLVVTSSGTNFDVNVDLPPEVGKDWVVTALDPAIVTIEPT